MHIEKVGEGLTIRLEGGGMEPFFLQTLMRAKFYDDGGSEGLLSPLLNSAIKGVLETLGARQEDATAHYAEWVMVHHRTRVQALLSTSRAYRSASPAAQHAMMCTALYPYLPPPPAPA